MPTTANSITYYVAADGTLRDGEYGSIAQTPRIYYGTEYSVTLTFPASTIAEGDQLQVAVNRTRTFFSSASATGDAPVAAVSKHDVTSEEAAAQAVTLTLSTNTRAMIDQVNGIDHPVRGFFGVHVLRGQSFVTLAVADALMMSLESGPDAISPSLPVVDYPTREEAIAIKDEAMAAAGKAKEEADRAEEAAEGIVPPLQLDSPPTTSTVGSVGQLAVWHDSSATDQSKADHEYHLLYIVESAGGKEYIWREDVTENQRNVAGGFAGLNADAVVPINQLPKATTEYGVVRTNITRGTSTPDGYLSVMKAADYEINQRLQNYKPITPSNLDYAVRSVLPNVTEIPAATSDYSLVDSSATTLNHSHTFVHTPSQAPTYRLPSVSDATISHYIELTVDFTNVQTYSFLDANGDALVPLFTPSIAVGDVYTFRMEYSAIKAKWLIYPQKQGAVADDFVMRGEVGVANGVASLNANEKIPPSQIPLAIASSGKTSEAGGIRIDNRFAGWGYNGVYTDSNGFLYIGVATSTQINNRTLNSSPSLTAGHEGYLTPAIINYAVKASITDSKHFTLTDKQKATAQEVFGVGGAITEIPAATSEYTLSWGRFAHTPSLASVYVLPAVSDGSITNDITLSIKFSSTVLTYEFQDSDGTTLVPLPLNGDIEAGSVVTFLCRYESLLSQWVIMPVMVGKEAQE